MDNVADMHWSQLKKLVEGKGGKYEGKAQAIAFLGGDPKVDPIEPVTDKASPDSESFNHNKPHGTVHGDVDGAPGARYCQGGSYFNAQGKKVG